MTTYQALIAQSKREALEKKYIFLWIHVLKGPGDLTSQYKFHPRRKWLFDFAHLPTKVAIEVEGGIYKHGRHQRTEGFKNDCEKYLEAGLLGWRVLRLSSNMVTGKNLERIIAFIRAQPIQN